MGELRLDPLIGLIAAARTDLVAVLLSRCDRVFTAAMACANHGVALSAINVAARLAKL
jgi:hypothetical protein